MNSVPLTDPLVSSRFRFRPLRMATSHATPRQQYLVPSDSRPTVCSNSPERSASTQRRTLSLFMSLLIQFVELFDHVGDPFERSPGVVEVTGHDRAVAGVP